jgi:hypothetical protein
MKRALLGIAAVAVLATGAHLGAPQASAAVGPADDRMISSTVPWWTYNGVTIAQVNTYLTTNDARLTDIHVESSTPTVSVVMVKNSGSYKVANWWWYVGLSLSDVQSRLSTNSARLISISAYDTSAGTRYGVIMVSNTGANARGWWWYDAPATYIADKLAANHARLIDLGPSPNGNFTAIMVDNSGANAVAWYWYHGIKAKQIRSYATAHDGRPIDVSRNPGGSFNAVIYVSIKAGDSFAGRTPSALLAKAISRDERILSIDTYIVSGVTLQAAAMIKNSH